MHTSAVRVRLKFTNPVLELWKIIHVLGCAATVMPNYRYEAGRQNGLTRCFRRNWERGKLFQVLVRRIYLFASQGNWIFNTIVVQTNNTAVWSAVWVELTCDSKRWPSLFLQRGRDQTLPAWHTKAAPNGKCCEGYIVPSMVRLMYQLKSVLK